jgi:hypothetical protein
MFWYGRVRAFTKKSRIRSLVENGRARYGTVRHGTARYGTVRHGTVRYGTVRYGTVRTLRYGQRINSDPLLYRKPSLNLPWATITVTNGGYPHAHFPGIRGNAHGQKTFLDQLKALLDQLFL